MALDNVWLGPVFLALYSISALLICVCLAYHNNQLPPRWPYLSELATLPPASNVYCLMTNHMAIMVAIWVYMKHREIVSYFSMEGDMPKKRILSTINMSIGLLAAVALEFSANFPKSKIPYLQTSASFLLLTCTVVYIWIHTFISFFIVDANISRIKLMVCRLTLAATLSSCTASMFKLFDSTQPIFGKTTPSPESLAPSAVFEWAIYLSMCLFLLTDAYEFRNVTFIAPKLVIPGSPIYDETRHLIPQRPREMSFSDLPTASLSNTLVR